MNRTRLVAAFLFAPIAPVIVMVVPGLLMGASVSSAKTIFIVASFVTYAHAVVLGIPVAWLLGRFSQLSFLRVLVAAFVVGMLPFGVLTLHQELTMPTGSGYEANGVVLRENGRLTSAGLRSAVFGVMEGGALGALAGLVWWAIAMQPARRQAK